MLIVVGGDDNVPFLLVGNKCDLSSKRAVPLDEALRLADSWKVPYIETSAKTRLNVDKVFNDLMEEIYKRKCSQGRDSIKSGGDGNNGKRRKKRKCKIL